MNVGPDHRPVDRGHNQHGEPKAFKPLLVFHVLVAGQKNVEVVPFDQFQQRSVFDATPLHADNSMNVMPGEGPRQLVRHVLIEENFQGCA